MMNARWEYGEAVRLTRNVRNDGTYPGLDPGAPLVRRGSIGYVVDVGTFLQDQVIYSGTSSTKARSSAAARKNSSAPKKPGRPRASSSATR
jgi:hypothetical protein